MRMECEAGQRGRVLLPAAAAALGAAAFLVYLRTLAPSIVWGDSPELITAAYHAGVPHPSGYPLYMLLGNAFVRLVGLGSAAYRMNLLSALTAAVTVGLLFLLTLRVTRSVVAGAVAALLFAFSRTFWSQAVIAEVYALHLLLMTGTLLCVVTWDRTGDRRWLLLSAVSYGLCFTHHLLSVLLAPGLLYLAATSPRRQTLLRELRWTLPLFLLPLLLYAYVPLAALRDSPMNWNDPRTWENFVRHVSGWEYQGRMFSRPPAAVWSEVVEYGGYLWSQFTPAVLPVALLGIYRLFRKDRRVLGLTALVYLTVVIYSVNYDIGDVEVYYLPAHLMTVLWVAAGIRHLGFHLRRAWRRLQVEPIKRPLLTRAAASALALLPLGTLAGNWSDSDRRDDLSALTYARTALASLKPDAVLLANGDLAMLPLTYALFVEQRRPDVTLVRIIDMMYPHRLRLATRLRDQGLVVRVPDCYTRPVKGGIHRDGCLLDQLVADNIGRRPLYLAAEPERLATSKWLYGLSERYFRVERSTFYISELAQESPTVDATGHRPQYERRVRFSRPGGPELEFAGYDAEPVTRGDATWLRLRYYWRTSAAEAAGARVRVLLTDQEGNYRETPEGPALSNWHALGQVAGPRTAKLPPYFRETFEVFVPPSEWNRRLSLWIGVESGGEPLLADAGRPFVEAGVLPVASAPAAERVVARPE